MIRTPLLDSPATRHGFFTREGGVSGGIFASLNCSLGSGDEPAKVEENRRRVLAQLGLGGDCLVTCPQVHGAEVVMADKPWAQGDRPSADAMVTRRKGLALGILTADCAPVLFADAEAGIVAAAHAGWRGALAGVATAIGIAVVYWVTSGLFEAMGNASQLPPSLAAWSPDLLFALAGGYLILKVPT